MTKYSRKDLDREARLVARDIRLETHHPAKVKDWSLYLDLNGTNTCLAVVVACYDGERQRNVAI